MAEQSQLKSYILSSIHPHKDILLHRMLSIEHTTNADIFGPTSTHVSKTYEAEHTWIIPRLC